MAVTHRKKPVRMTGTPITRGDLKLLFCVAVFAASVALKYANFDAARELRAQAAMLVRGGADAGEVLETVGHAVGDDGILAVFSGKQPLREVFAPSSDAPPQSETGAAEPTPVEPAGTDAGNEAEAAMPAYAEGGYSEDLEDREETLFPKEADETAYVLAFSHVPPVKAVLSSPFGGRTHPISGKTSYHFGLDLAAPKGTPIGAFADGTVRESGSGSYGNYLIVDHADGISTLYAHCDKLIAKKGEAVKAGQEIAQVGATGNATGNHLHFEIWRDGKALNPSNYVQYE